jgi:integrase
VDAQARLQAGTLSAAAGPTLAEAAEQFIADMKSDTFRQRGGHAYKPSTVQGYERDLTKYAVPELGSKRISRLQRPELQRWVDGLTTPERSPSTIRNIVAALRALTGFAELRGWVHVNPCNGLRLPAGQKARDRIASPAEAEELIAAMRPKDRATLGLAVYAGLRLGELLALDVAAVDLDGSWIHVHRSWDRGTKQFISTKSRKPRSVPIIDKLAVLLADHFVLLDHPADLKPLGFHEGRHTYASIGIAAGLNPKTLSTYLGHATITLDRYGHLMPGSEVEARAMLDAYLAVSD